MRSMRKFIVEMEGRAVYSTKSYSRARQVAWHLIARNKECEVFVHLYGIICGI